MKLSLVFTQDAFQLHLDAENEMEQTVLRSAKGRRFVAIETSEHFLQNRAGYLYGFKSPHGGLILAEEKREEPLR